MPTIYTNKEKIKIQFPEKIFNIYLKKNNLKSTEELNDVNIFEIIKACFKDFKIGLVSLDDFSSIGGYLFGELKPESKSTRLGSVLLDIGELNFYIRNSSSDIEYSEISDFLSRIDKYFESH